MSALPWADPQFWVVSVTALAALALFVRPLLRRRRAGGPCPRCARCAPAPSRPIGIGRRTARASAPAAPAAK